MTVQSGEDRPCQNELQVLPITKGQGGQVSFMAHLHSCMYPHGAQLGRWFFISAVTVTATVTATATATATATVTAADDFGGTSNR